MDFFMNEKISRLLAVFILFILIAVFYTYPLAFNISLMLPGEGQSDTPLSVWNIWHLKESLFVRHDLLTFTTNYIFWPQRPSLILHNYTPATGLMSLPWQSFFTPLASRNLLLFLQFALTGTGMYLLAFLLSHNRIAALWAAVTLAFCPYVIVRSCNSLHIFTIWYFPWFIYFFLRFLGGGKLKFAIGAAIIYALCLWDEQTYFVLISLLCLFLLAFALFYCRDKWDRTYLKNSSIGILIFLILAFPYLMGLSGQLMGAGESLKIWPDICIDYFSLHAPDLFRPPALLSLYRNLPYVTLPVLHITNAFLGYVPLFFALFALINFRDTSAEKRKIIGFWAVTGLIFFLIASGPFCFGKNQFLAGFSPYSILCSGILRQLRIPVRFSLVTLIAIYIIGAFGVERLIRIQKGRLINNLTLSLFLIILQTTEFLPLPYPLLNLEVPAAYCRLANYDKNSPLLVLPLGWQSSYRTVGIYDRKIQFYQTIHGHPIFQGQIGRLEDKYFDYYLSQPGFQYLIAAHQKKPGANDKIAVYALLKKYGIKQAVIHVFYFDKEHRDALLRLFRDYPGGIEAFLAP